MVEKLDLGYTEQSLADGKQIKLSVQGAGIGFGAWFGFGFAGLLLGGLVSLMLLAETAMPFVLVFGGCLSIAALLSSTRGGTQIVTLEEETIRLSDGREIKKTDISELFVKSSDGKNIQQASSSNGTIVFGSGAVGAAVVGAHVLNNGARQIGDATGKAIQESMAKRGFSVCVRHGRKVIPLAKYLREDDAISLFNRIAQAF